VVAFRAVLVAAVSNEHKLLLAGMAVIFIAFALVSSLVLPRRDPNYPGRGLDFFLATTIVLFVCMMLTVEFFAVEEEEHEGSPEGAPALIRE